MASARVQFQDLEAATFVDLLKNEVAKHGASLSGKASYAGNWQESGEAAVEDVWSKTIRPFRDNFKKDPNRDGLTRLNGDAVVSDYVVRAIAAIGSKATDLARDDGGASVEVDGWHVRQAAHWVIKRFRAVCPPQIAKRTFETDNPKLK